MSAQRADAVAPAAATAMILTLARTPDVSSTARDAVRRFTDRLGARCTDDACLLVSELVTNAYEHSRGQIRLTIALHDHVGRFAVLDDGDATLPPTARPDEHGGWGLHIVARVADRWGTDRAPTHVWFELHADGQHTQQPIGSQPDGAEPPGRCARLNRPSQSPTADRDHRFAVRRTNRRSSARAWAPARGHGRCRSTR